MCSSLNLNSFKQMFTGGIVQHTIISQLEDIPLCYSVFWKKRHSIIQLIHVKLPEGIGD